MYEKLKDVNILYVEDDVFIREQTSSLLNVVFNKVFTANDGQDGLEQFTLSKNEINVIVTDINMPNLSGVEMVKEIKKLDTANTPVVVVSVYSQDEKNLANTQDLFTKYLRKPTQIKEIIESIVEVLEK